MTELHTPVQRCFLDIEIGKVFVGRIVVELDTAQCPKTSRNFCGLCTGLNENTDGGEFKGYKGTIFHRVVKGFMIQGGDTGTGGESIYGGTFEDEYLSGEHYKAYFVSMANKGPDTNGSQFFITTQPAPHLNKKHVLFGRVVSGYDVIREIEGLPVDRKCRPLQEVVIAKCGELVLREPSKDSKKKSNKRTYIELSEDSTSSEVIPKRKSRKHKKRSHKEEPIEETENKTSVNHPLNAISDIKVDEIPYDPPNRFLFRGERKFDEQENGNTRNRQRPQIRMISKSGREIKGRGVLRYRTPSRSPSRSVTPPHWRRAQGRTISMKDFEKNAKKRQERNAELKRRESAREKRHRERDEQEQLKESRHLGSASIITKRNPSATTGGNVPDVEEDIVVKEINKPSKSIDILRLERLQKNDRKETAARPKPVYKMINTEPAQEEYLKQAFEKLWPNSLTHAKDEKKQRTKHDSRDRKSSHTVNSHYRNGKSEGVTKKEHSRTASRRYRKNDDSRTSKSSKGTKYRSRSPHSK